MGGMTNLSNIQERGATAINSRSNTAQKAQSQLYSEDQSLLAFTGNQPGGAIKGGTSSVDPSRLGGHATRTTEYTSNIGANTTTEGGAMGLGAASSNLNAPPPGSATGNAAID